MLPARDGGDSWRLPGSTRRKIGDDEVIMPLNQGYTCHNGEYRGCLRDREGSESLKLVSVRIGGSAHLREVRVASITQISNAAVNTFPGLVHRPSRHES